jgi:hypothetical protein
LEPEDELSFEPAPVPPLGKPDDPESELDDPLVPEVPLVPEPFEPLLPFCVLVLPFCVLGIVVPGPLPVPDVPVPKSGWLPGAGPPPIPFGSVCAPVCEAGVVSCPLFFAHPMGPISTAVRMESNVKLSLAMVFLQMVFDCHGVRLTAEPRRVDFDTVSESRAHT